MFRFLGVVIVGAALVVLGAWINVWVGVVVAVLAVGAIVWWLMQEPVPGAAEPTPKLESHTPDGMHRVLILVAPGGSAPAIPDRATEVLVVVPALASTTEALTGAVDDRRAEAEQTAQSLARALSRDGRSVRCEVGADDPVLAVEDALRAFGADEVVVAGDDAMVEQVRARVAVPVARA